MIKKRFKFSVFFLGVLFSPALLQATFFPSITTEEWISQASHIFEGTTQNITIVDKDLNPVEPEPSGLSPFETYALLKVKVEKVLRPNPDAWNPKKEINVLFGEGHFEVQKIKSDFLGKKLIYVTKLEDENRQIYKPAYFWRLFSLLKEKEKLLTLIQQNPYKDTHKADE